MHTDSGTEPPEPNTPADFPVPPPPGRTRWGRFCALAIANLIAAAGLLVLTATSALPVSVALSGIPVKVSAARLEGSGFLQVPQLDLTGSAGQPIALTTLISARITSLCQSTAVPTPIGPVTLRITSGEGAPVEVQDLVLNLTDLLGNTTFSGIGLGALRPDSEHPDGADYAQRADSLVIDDLRLTTRQLVAGTLQVPGLRFDVSLRGPECF
ncbi:hypothetical protein SAMN05421810_104152 [Amycolatopsis arida]|uniref:Cholesterol esterase n=1 Tax=Amycolatopsis arida TaxID=587909 RepID=A0A1I5UXL4_9PSEU|nr:DUF6230 family protein [Amycolatopsis arida]TDX91071.1 hypothetical protein CLV69_106151 [Amycolatopsis arida]SFP99960.1 hypothetical protein SAMN05421810_104152 [Amycolatopsis arida]